MKKQNIGLYVLAIFVLGICVTLGVNAYNGTANTVMENVTIEAYNVADSSGDALGAVAGPNVFMDMVFHGTVKMREATRAIAKTDITASTTLAVEESGTNFLLSASGTEIILPAVANTGVKYRFTINGASADANFAIKVADGTLEGTLLVAGAVVDCAAETRVNFITDGENIGDFFEIVSDGTYWLIGASGALSSSKLTCTGG